MGMLLCWIYNRRVYNKPTVPHAWIRASPSLTVNGALNSNSAQTESIGTDKLGLSTVHLIHPSKMQTGAASMVRRRLVEETELEGR